RHQLVVTMSGHSKPSSMSLTVSAMRAKRQTFSRRPVKVLTESGKDFFRQSDYEEPISSGGLEYRPKQLPKRKDRQQFNRYFDDGFTEDYMTGADEESVDDYERHPKKRSVKDKQKSIKSDNRYHGTRDDMNGKRRDNRQTIKEEAVLKPRIVGIPVYTRLGDNNKEFVKLMSDIKSRKQRERQNLMILEGKRLIGDAINAGVSLKTIYFSKEENLVDIEGLEQMVANGVQLKKVLFRDLQLFSDVVNSPGLIAVAQRPTNQTNRSNGHTLPLILIGDNIRDPGNLGTMVRCAAAVGAMSLVLTKGCADVWEPKVVRAGAGSHFRVPIVSGVEWPLLFNYLPIDKPFDLYIAESNDYQPMGRSGEHEIPSHTVNTITKTYSQTKEVTVLRDDSYDESNEELAKYRNSAIAVTNYCETRFYTSGIDRPAVLVIGGETHGLSDQSYKLAYDYIGRRLRIPLSAGVDSLNSAVASAVIMYEMKRQFHCLQKCVQNECIQQIV
ncbi:unnamed protein product, partial [Oppiella nova]